MVVVIVAVMVAVVTMMMVTFPVREAVLLAGLLLVLGKDVVTAEGREEEESGSGGKQLHPRKDLADPPSKGPGIYTRGIKRFLPKNGKLPPSSFGLIAYGLGRFTSEVAVGV